MTRLEQIRASVANRDPAFDGLGGRADDVRYLLSLLDAGARRELVLAERTLQVCTLLASAADLVEKLHEIFAAVPAMDGPHVPMLLEIAQTFRRESGVPQRPKVTP